MEIKIIFKNIGLAIRKSSPKRKKKTDLIFSLYYKSYDPYTK